MTIKELIDKKQDLEHMIEDLIEACQFTLDMLDTMTTEEFSHGKDKPAIDKLTNVLNSIYPGEYDQQ